MAAGHPVNWLMFGTLAVALAIVIIALLRFMRHRGNRHPMHGRRDRNIDEIRGENPRPPR